MKIISILLLVLGCLLVVGSGIMYLILFAYSFDAPGSESSSKAWGSRLLMFLPVLVLIVVLVLAFIAFFSGNYARATGFGALFVVALVAIFIFLIKNQADNNRKVREMRAQELEDAKYPVQTFFRPTENGTDTIIVFPSRIVAYRIFNKTFNKTIGGPIGTLNQTRDTILVEKDPGEFPRRQEFEQFINEEGKKITEVFQFR
ncbi:MAG: hypothetical protein HUU01_06205 [Saprospiraceae bacterium]|nr:hypothetical protein [Saprospiraceae bacterium]